MTISDLQSDPSFDRHPSTALTASESTWLHVAARILSLAHVELLALDRSTRESLITGLQSIAHPDAQSAVLRISQLPKPKILRPD